MYNINHASAVNYSPNFGISIFRTKSNKVAKSAIDMLTEKGVTINSCGIVSNRQCNTRFGFVVLEYNGENYNMIIPKKLVNGGYYDNVLGRNIPCTLADGNAVAADVLDKCNQLGDGNMQKFLETCEKIYQRTV